MQVRRREHSSGTPALLAARIPPDLRAARVCMLSHFSRVPFFAIPWEVALQVHENLQARKLERVAIALFQGIFPTQVSNAHVSYASCIGRKVLHH